MRISYLPVTFRLCFEKPVVPDNNPLFTLRSVLGMNLRDMCCVKDKKNKCADCLFMESCPYCFIFETVLSKENSVLPGRDRASHPFSLNEEGTFWHRGERIKEFSFTVTLYGKAIEYFSSICKAFVLAGINGLFKERVKFAVKEVLVKGESILQEEGSLLPEKPVPLEWNMDFLEIPARKQVLLCFNSPVRFRVNGEYVKDFTEKDLVSCMWRRARTLCSLYGEYGGEEVEQNDPSFVIKERNLAWHSEVRYSARQKNKMDLGGFTGTLKLEGLFTPFELSLLEFSRITNIGKNTNFGLGQMDFMEKDLDSA